MTKHSIGIAGLGIMGAGMAHNFLRNGHEVFVWNRSEDKTTPVVEAGAKAVETPGELCERAKLVFEVTSNDESSRSVFTGDNGLLSTATKNNTLIASSTLSLDWVDELIETCRSAGIKFMDIPLTGSRAGAESGTLTLMVGADDSDLDDAAPSLESISSKILHFGGPGQGARFKLILNTMLSLQAASYGEARRMAEQFGLDANQVGDALSEKPGGVAFEMAHQLYGNQPDQIAFELSLMTKDLRYAKYAASAADTPLLDSVSETFEKRLAETPEPRDWTWLNEPS